MSLPDPMYLAMSNLSAIVGQIPNSLSKNPFVVVENAPSEHLRIWPLKRLRSVTRFDGRIYSSLSIHTTAGTWVFRTPYETEADAMKAGPNIEEERHLFIFDGDRVFVETEWWDGRVRKLAFVPEWVYSFIEREREQE